MGTIQMSPRSKLSDRSTHVKSFGPHKGYKYMARTNTHSSSSMSALCRLINMPAALLCSVITLIKSSLGGVEREVASVCANIKKCLVHNCRTSLGGTLMYKSLKPKARNEFRISHSSATCTLTVSIGMLNDHVYSTEPPYIE